MSSLHRAVLLVLMAVTCVLAGWTDPKGLRLLSQTKGWPHTHDAEASPIPSLQDIPQLHKEDTGMAFPVWFFRYGMNRSGDKPVSDPHSATLTLPRVGGLRRLAESHLRGFFKSRR